MDHHIWFSQVLRHWLVRWFIQNVEFGRGMQSALWMDGRPQDAYLWDGGACTVFGINKRPLHDYGDRNTTEPETETDQKGTSLTPASLVAFEGRRRSGSDSFGL